MVVVIKWILKSLVSEEPFVNTIDHKQDHDNHNGNRECDVRVCIVVVNHSK